MWQVLKRTELEHEGATEAKDETRRLWADGSNGRLEFSFEIPRRGDEKFKINLHTEDLRELLLQIAKSSPEHSLIFLECLSETTRSRESLLSAIEKDVVSSTDEERDFEFALGRKTKDFESAESRQWYHKLCKRLEEKYRTTKPWNKTEDGVDVPRP